MTPDDRHLDPRLADAVGRLPRRIEPPRDLWPEIRGRIRNGRGEGRGGRRWARWLPLAAAALALLAAGIRFALRRPAWAVERMAGAPRIDGRPLAAQGSLRVGQWLVTDDSSRALVSVGAIGRVDVRPGTRLRLLAARDTEHRLALAYGAIHASVDAPPRLFFVETPAGTAIDLGCEYTLLTDSLGRGLLHVTRGYVEFASGRTRSVVPLGAYAPTRPGSGPGIPYVEDAPAALRDALLAFEFDDGGAAAVRRALAAARAADGISLWHLLTRVPASERGAVYDRLAALVPPPAGVTRAAAVAADRAALARYWSHLRRIQFRRVILRGIRDIDPRTGLAR